MKAPKEIRDTCKLWSRPERPNMAIIARGETDYYQFDLLLEVISCLIKYKITPENETKLRKVENWLLSDCVHWTTDKERGKEFDQSKGLENG